jgi:hypothetical protein
VKVEDAQGLPVSSTSNASLAHYDAAVREMFFFREDVVAETAAALAEDPLAPMPNILAAYLALMSTQPAGAAATFAGFAGRTAGRDLLPRERAHAEAAQAWLAGDTHGAGARLAALTVAYPRDALALLPGTRSTFSPGGQDPGGGVDGPSRKPRLGGR